MMMNFLFINFIFIILYNDKALALHRMGSW